MDSMTRESVEAAFARESRAHLKYIAFARQAKEDGYPNVARVFRAIAASEKRHALQHLEMLGGVGSTQENLREAYERDERKAGEICSMCGESEGGPDNPGGASCDTLEAEKSHLLLYDEAKSAVNSDEDLEETPIYVCGGCGRTVRGEAPERCPVCDTPSEEFEVY
ncbi:MAG: rubrerythrin family protein [Armatimonadota bacterium]